MMDRYWKYREVCTELKPYQIQLRQIEKLERKLLKLQSDQHQNVAEIEKVQAELLDLATSEVGVDS